MNKTKAESGLKNLRCITVLYQALKNFITKMGPYLIMEVNVGKTDQMFRVFGGIAMGTLSIYALIDKCVPEYYSPVFGLFAIIFLVTGLTRKCPVCKLAGHNSLEEEQEN